MEYHAIANGTYDNVRLTDVSRDATPKATWSPKFKFIRPQGPGT